MQISVVIEDKEFVDSAMNGKPWKAGKFAFGLRLSLWAEHLGLNIEEVGIIINMNDNAGETSTYHQFPRGVKF